MSFKRLLQINTTVNSGSTGRIAEDIGKLFMQQGHESYIAFGRGHQPSASKTIRIGSTLDFHLHALKTRLFDLHGFGSTSATRDFIEKVKEINPDVFHLHNIHGYYLNVEALFRFLKEADKPVVWTFHDCWPFTGHCSHFDFINCNKWETQCYNCPNTKGYPASWCIDNSKKNYQRKKELFSGLKNLTIVTPSKWLENHVTKSYLKEYSVITIYNGVDLNIFKPSKDNWILGNYKLVDQNYILGVANVWSQRKGLDDFFQLRQVLPSDLKIVLVGLNEHQIRGLTDGIIGIQHTENISQLAALYSKAKVFVNPTYVDNFPTTNIEALACGTPVVTYNTGGSKEAICGHTGLIVSKGNILGLAEAINRVLNNYMSYKECRTRAETLYDNNNTISAYLNLYMSLP